MAYENSEICGGWQSEKCVTCEEFEKCQSDVRRGCALGSIIASVFIAITFAIVIRFIL